jgi:hypothetical protein
VGSRAGGPELPVFDAESATRDLVGFVAWLVVGILVYTGYGLRHSRLATNEDQQEGAPPAVASAEL